MENPAVFLIGTLLSLSALSASLSGATIEADLESSPDGLTWVSAEAGLVAFDSSPTYYRATVRPTGGTDTVTNVILVSRSAGNPAHVRLESGSDLTAWSPDIKGTHDVTASMKFFRVNEDAAFSELIFIDGGTVQLGEVNFTVSDFRMGQFEVSQEIWDDVYNWALSNGYDFTNMVGGNWMAGGCEKRAHPIRDLSWFDVVKWCNARSEKEALDPVYYAEGSVYKTGVPAVSVVLAGVDTGANGYRLPTLDEWTYSALGGQLSQGYTYSGSDTVSEVARYRDNSSGSGCPILPPEFTQGTWPCGSLLPNELGLFDMSGNVKEWVLEGQSLTNRYIMNGSFIQAADRQEVTSVSSTTPASTLSDVGFRLARNAPPPPSSAIAPGASLLSRDPRKPASFSRKKGSQKKLK